MLFDDAADLRALQALRLAEILLLVSRAVLNKFIRDVRSDFSEVASTGGALLHKAATNTPTSSWSCKAQKSYRAPMESLMEGPKPLSANFDGYAASAPQLSLIRI